MTYEEANTAVRALALELANNTGARAQQAIEAVAKTSPALSNKRRKEIIATLRALAADEQSVMHARIILGSVQLLLVRRLIEPAGANLAKALGLHSNDSIAEYVEQLFTDSSFSLSLSRAANASIANAFQPLEPPTTCS